MKIYLDISTVLDDETRAVAEARSAQQLAVFDLSTHETRYLDDLLNRFAFAEQPA
jgi:hypothetical protein